LDKEQTLTSKVSETYQKLGELDEACRLLADKSGHIGDEIKALSKNIVQITEKSELDIGQLTEGYGALITRTDELWKKSRQTTQKINDSRSGQRGLQRAERTAEFSSEGGSERPSAFVRDHRSEPMVSGVTWPGRYRARGQT
jgi:hypothetical protein